jgi:purine-binding chemotaxis protein CheW
MSDAAPVPPRLERRRAAPAPAAATAAATAALPSPAADVAATHLLVRAGDYICALPLAAVRRVLRALTLHPLPGSAPELKGLAEFAGDPLPVLDLARLARAPQGANPIFPVTVVVWAGSGESRELVGLAADAALAVVQLSAASVGGDGGFVAGETVVAGQVVRVINLERLGAAA